MIKQEFIPYEQALELNKLGFNEKCSFYWSVGYEDFKQILSSEKYQKGNSISAPLYQQCWRWFREKYNLPSHIHTIWQYDWNNYSYQWHITENKEEWNCVEHLKTYEEAELECLKKLIEICKKIN